MDVAAMREFVGTRVTVTMRHKQQKRSGRLPKEVTGTLLAVNDEGECVVYTATGRRFCWPASDVRAAV